MSTANNKNTAKEMTNEEMTAMMQNILNGQQEILQKQETVARTVGDFDSRLSKIENQSAKQPAIEQLEEAVAKAEAGKPGMMNKFKQASTGKKVVIATVATAAVGGAAYAGYKGYEMYQGRKAVQESNILGAEAVGTPVTPAKQDAIRQGLSISK